MSAKIWRPDALDFPEVASELASVFECPICFDLIMPPITQCVNGHLLCSSCSKNISSVCPLCREQISHTRALAIEKVAGKLPYPCSYSSNGCTAQPLLNQKPDHERTCDFRTCPCIFADVTCKWTGTAKQMVAHVREAHQNSIVNGDKMKFVATNVDSRDPGVWKEVQSCLDQMFVVVLSREENIKSVNQFYLLVQILGTLKESKKFVCQLKVRGNGHLLTWSSPPSSIVEGVEAVIARRDCLVFGEQAFTCEGSLTVDVTVTVNIRETM
ncbi:E3 ubiquitin-protein ligase Siah2-like isoform X2 [Dermacentor albipictus]